MLNQEFFISANQDASVESRMKALIGNKSEDR